MPDTYDIDPLTGNLILPDTVTAPIIMQKLMGTKDIERFQTWPERMVRSGFTAPGDAYAGRLPIESPTGYPGSIEPTAGVQMEPRAIPKMLGMGNFTVPSSESEIARVQDTSGMAGMGGIGMTPKGALGSSGSNAFYSNLERTIANSKVEKATPEQWTSYLRNQPGIKSEELEFSLNNLPNKQLTKAELEQHIAENGVKLGEVWKGDLKHKIGEFNEKFNEEANKKFGRNYDDLGPFQKRQIDDLVNEMYERGPTKYSSYQLPGAIPDSYRELLLTVPQKELSPELAAKNYYENFARKGGWPTWEELQPAAKKSYYEIVKENNYNKDTTANYQSSHWDEPNVLAHIRMNDRDIGAKPVSEIEAKLQEAYPNIPIKNLGSGIPKKAVSEGVLTAEEAADLSRSKGWLSGFEDKKGTGLKTLHIEEIQSDALQQGRKSGFRLPEQELRKLDNRRVELENLGGELRNQGKEIPEVIKTEWADIKNKIEKNASAVPNFPFKKSWDELALKRVLTEAATKGYDALSWTPGEAQAARYDLSKQLNAVGVIKHDNGTFSLEGFLPNGGVHDFGSNVPANKLANYVGKDLAEKISNQKDKHKEYSGLDLKVGGEGMKGFYDTMLPNVANKLIKKMGGKVEYEYLPDTSSNFKIRSASDMGGGVEIVNRNGEIINHSPTRSDAQEWINEHKGQKIPVIRITPQMREKISKEGFPLFTAPVYVPVSEPPDFGDKKQSKLTAVSHNPFAPRLVPTDIQPEF